MRELFINLKLPRAARAKRKEKHKRKTHGQTNCVLRANAPGRAFGVRCNPVIIIHLTPSLLLPASFTERRAFLCSVPVCAKMQTFRMRAISSTPFYLNFSCAQDFFTTYFLRFFIFVIMYVYKTSVAFESLIHI